jgi:outer membrane protein OmpA-like peptidoglycan-associated protein
MEEGMKQTVLNSILLLTIVLVSSTATAQDNPNVNVNDFVPSVHAWDHANVMGTRIQDGLQYSSGLWFAYRKNAFSVQGKAAGQLVSSQVVGDVYMGTSLFGWGSVGIDLPIFFATSGETAANGLVGASGAALGDLRLSLKGKFWQNGNTGFGLGLAQDITFPTSTGNNYTGEEGVSSTTTLIADYNWKGWSGALNVAYFARPDVKGFDPEFEDELRISAAIVAPIICDRLDVLATTQTRTPISEAFAGKEYVAMNVLAGARVWPFEKWVFTALGGSGVGTLPGNPSWQVMVNLGYEERTWSCRAKPCEGDQCPQEDRDEDGVPDSIDDCPDDPGPESLQGCPDRDDDGLLDKNDLCPDKPGPKGLKGCPDRDRDGIPDRDDKCPDQKGPLATTGCPDADGDGIADKEDRCPDSKGLRKLKGCPDKDEDGVADIDDNCPEDKGPANAGGCPDKDGDTVPDKDDECPEVPGRVSTKGCPDRDEDGIIDSKDKCPDKYGVAEHEGCPPPTPKTIKFEKKKIVILDKVYFDTNLDTIKYSSGKILKDVATVLIENPSIKLIRIEGYTDNRGEEDFNQELSLDRAKAVVKFLVKQGVKSERLEARGYGSSVPLAEGDNEESWAKNRRVEFTILDPK